MFYGWLLAENFTVLGYSLNTEETMRGANSVPTYSKSAGGCGFLATDPAATRMRKTRT